MLRVPPGLSPAAASWELHDMESLWQPLILYNFLHFNFHFFPLVSSVAEPWFGNYKPVVSAVGNQRKHRGDKYLSVGAGRNIIMRLQGWKTEP